MSGRSRSTNVGGTSLSGVLAQLRARSGLTQSQVAQRMATTQTAVARLESGRQSPNVETLYSFARANGFCLEIGFITATSEDTGCILMIEDHSQ